MSKPPKCQKKLLKAIGKGDPESVREALEQGADANLPVIDHLQRLYDKSNTKSVKLAMPVIWTQGNYLHFAFWHVSHGPRKKRDNHVAIVNMLIEAGADVAATNDRDQAPPDLLCVDCLSPAERAELAERCRVPLTTHADYRWFEAPSIEGCEPSAFPGKYPAFEGMVDRWRSWEPYSFTNSGHGYIARKMERRFQVRFPDTVRQWCAAQPRWFLPLLDRDRSAFRPSHYFLRHEEPGHPPSLYYRAAVLEKIDADSTAAAQVDAWVRLGGDEDPELFWATAEPEESEHPYCPQRTWRGHWTSRPILRPSGVRFTEFVHCDFVDELTIRLPFEPDPLDGAPATDEQLERTKRELEYFGNYTDPWGVTGHRFFGQKACVTILTGERMSRIYLNGRETEHEERLEATMVDLGWLEPRS